MTPANAAALVAGTLNHCDSYQQADANPAQERRSFGYTFNQDVTSFIHFDAEGYASRRNFKLVVAPTALTVTVPSTNAFYVAPAGVTPPLCPAATDTLYGIPATPRCETVLYKQHQRCRGPERALRLFSGLRANRGLLGRPCRRSGRRTCITPTASIRTSTTIGPTSASTPPMRTRPWPAATRNTAFNVFGGPNNASVVSATTPNGIYNQLFDTGGHTIIKVGDEEAGRPGVRPCRAGEIRAALGYQNYTRCSGGATTRPAR